MEFDGIVGKQAATGKVVRKTADSVARVLEVNDDLSWGVILSLFATGTKQMDTMWLDMEPLLSMAIPTPKKPLDGPLTLPQLLDSIVSKEDSNSIIMPSMPEIHEAADFAILDKVQEHNSSIDDIVGDFNDRVNDLKKRRIERENKKKVEN